MITDAKTIQCAAEAGLHLVGTTSERGPEYRGTPEQWKRYGQLRDWVEQTGTFPWINVYEYEREKLQEY